MLPDVQPCILHRCPLPSVLWERCAHIPTYNIVFHRSQTCARHACREMFDTEAAAARGYDVALWRLKPREARQYVNFKDSCPPDVADMVRRCDQVRKGSKGDSGRLPKGRCVCLHQTRGRTPYTFVSRWPALMRLARQSATLL